MTTDEMMNIAERYKYLRILKSQYELADRKEKGRLLDLAEAMTGLHRKSLIRRLSSDLERRPRRQQRGRIYGAAVDDALRVISESLDFICPERLTPNLVWMAKHLEAHGELVTTPELLEDLERISASTVGRRIAKLTQDQPRLRRKGRSVYHSLRREIPMTRIPWDEQEPGHFEVDLVHHCGITTSGEYVCTLQLIDVATGWSERVAVLGRSYRVMKDAFLRILARLPFAVREIHPDNGNEFFNHHLLRFWKDTIKGVRLSRSRPYHKNDNRFVEQKNASLVRDYLGYERFDTVAQTLALNQLYDKMWVYYNLFQPVMRLAEKEFVRGINGQPARVRRRHDQARTPFDRLGATSAIPEQQHQQLEVLRQQTNPRQLRQEIYDLIDHLFSLPGADPEQSEDVHQTLGLYTISWQGEHSSVTLSFDEQPMLR